MQPIDLISTAKHLVSERGKGTSWQVDLKRSLSTTYFAMFHALCWNCADSLVGSSEVERSEPAWDQAYRAVEHGFAKKQFRNKAIMKQFPETIQDFGIKFVDLQDKRHLADYDPGYIISVSEVLTEINIVEDLVNKLTNLTPKHRTAFAVWTVMKKRVI